MVSSPSFVVVAGSGRLMAGLVEHYRGAGAQVAELRFDDGSKPELAAMDIAEPIDLLVVVDAFRAPGHAVADLTRAELAASMQRLTYLPFRIAAILKPQLAAGGGRAVLITDPDARMIATGSTSPYLDRPFRAAAHALWRCLSVEWQPEGIACGIVVVDHSRDLQIEAIARAIDGQGDVAFPVEIIDVEGKVLGW